MKRIKNLMQTKIYKKYFSCSLLIILAVIASCLATLGVAGSFYLYLFIIGSVIAIIVLYGGSYFKLPVILLTSLFWSSGLLIVLVAIFSLFSISVGVWILWLPVLLVVVLLLFRPIRIDPRFFKVSKFELLLFVILLMSIYSHVYSVKGYYAPILHDPMAHGTWAKAIYNTGTVQDYYSPGLHILSALGMMVDGVNVATYVLILTNLFNAIVFIPVYYFIDAYFNNKWIALVGSSFFLIGLFPSNYFWEAGKNALVLGIGFSFFSFFIASLKIGKKLKFTLVNLIALTLILVHYPMAIIALIGIAFILLFTSGLKGLMNLAGGVLLGGLWVVIFAGDEILRRIKSTFDFYYFLPQKVDIETVVALFTDTFIKTLYPFQSTLGNLILYLGITGLVVMLIIAFKEKRLLYFWGFILTNLFLVFLLNFVPAMRGFAIIYSTQVLTFFVFYYLGAAFLLAEIVFQYIYKFDERLQYLIMIIVVVLVGYRSQITFLDYAYHQESKNLVQKPDIEVFDWIKENLPEDAVVLNNVIRRESNRILHASDGGGWLYVFADRKIAMPFTDFYAREYPGIYNVYERLVNGSNECEDIAYLLENNIQYYFKGSRSIYGPQIDTNAESLDFELLFQSDSASIYQIRPCDDFVSALED